MTELKFVHDAIPRDSTYSLELKTQRYYDNIKYVEQSAATEVKVGFIEAPSYKLSDLLYLQNHTAKSNRTRLRNVRSFESTTIELSNTNYVFSDTKQGHTIYWYCTELEEAPSNVSIYRETRRGTEPVYDFLVEGDRIYYNFSNSYNPSTNNYTIYHLTYNSSTGVVTKLLEAQPVVRAVSWEDIDESGSIISGRKRYLINQVGTNYEYTFYNCNPKIFTRSGNEKISYDLKGLSTEDSIYVKLKLSEFSSSVDGTTYEYVLPEFTSFSETYDPAISYKIVTPSIIKLEGGELVRDETKPISISLYDRANNLLRTDYSDGAPPIIPIDKIDYKDGFILLPYAIEADQSLTISGYQKTDSYTVASLDVNPIFNTDFVPGSSYLFYWKPDQTETGIHWVLFSNGYIVKCSDPLYELTISGVFNTATIINISKEEAFQELFDVGSTASQQWLPIVEVHNTKDSSAATYFNLMEKKLLVDAFDFSTYHFVTLTDLLDSRGLEIPINKTIVVDTNYDLLSRTDFEEIKTRLSNFVTPGTLILERNVDDPVIENYEDNGSEAVWELSLNPNATYTVQLDTGAGFTILETITEQDSHLLTIDTSSSSTLLTYKLAVTYDSTSYDTNFLLEIMGAP
jgi:hypothetical protein